MLISHVCKLLAIGGSQYTTNAPDYSRYRATDFVGMIAVWVGIIFVLLFVLSKTGKPPRHH
jgi:hypothetical protein